MWKLRLVGNVRGCGAGIVMRGLILGDYSCGGWRCVGQMSCVFSRFVSQPVTVGRPVTVWVLPQCGQSYSALPFVMIVSAFGMFYPQAFCWFGSGTASSFWKVKSHGRG